VPADLVSKCPIRKFDVERLNLKRLNNVQLHYYVTLSNKFRAWEYLDPVNINRTWINIREHNKTSIKKNLIMTSSSIYYIYISWRLLKIIRTKRAAGISTVTESKPNLPLITVSFIFPSVMYKCKDYNIQNYIFPCHFKWV
jgi:hypothetical protein